MAMPAAEPSGPAATGPLDVTRLEAAARIVHSTLWGLWVVGAVVLVLGIVFHDRAATFGAATMVTAAPLLLAAHRAGWVGLATHGALGLVLAIGCYVLLTGGGVHDVGTAIFAVVIVMSALILDRRSSIMFSLLAVVAVMAIGTAELSGLVGTRLSHQVVAGDVVMLMAILGATAWLTQILVGSLYASLRDAHFSELTYREIFDATSEAIFIHDAETMRIVDANASASVFLGYTREEILGLSLEQLGGGVPEQGIDVMSDLIRRTETEGPQVVEWRAPRKDGTRPWAEVVLRAATIRGERRIIAAVRDISERKAVAQQLLASERLQAVGQLAGGVAHDFNNQLTAILANASLLRDRVSGAERSHVDAIVQCSNRSADLTRQLLAFARKGQAVDEVVDMDALIEEVMSLLERSIDKRIELSHRVDAPGAVSVKGDPSLLQNALLNLGLNARDAMPDGGSLRFETARASRDRLSPAARAELADVEGPFVVVRVVDTGTGMPPDVAARVFEPFFTTKRDGNGMGLSATYGTVRAHDGVITVASERGRGTTFELTLPATDARPRRHSAAPPKTPLPRLRVLLAEDDPPVARVTEAVLNALGCSVTHCEDGRAALDAFEARPDAFDLAVLDHAMPRMTGADLALELRRLRPALPIVATSGFGEAWSRKPAAPECVFLPKPFDMEGLRAALLEALDVGGHPVSTPDAS